MGEDASMSNDGLFLALQMRMNRGMNACMVQRARTHHRHCHKLTCKEAVDFRILLFVVYPGVNFSDL